ncbi:MAG: hypothetical protein IPO07_15465 [Haliscomenobacter sp.]|nr:hypothetical protein [Haliscomenobacter sp.]MBK9490010.1 hypothetical protein [Haliscomenobacter sp.]
MFKNINLPDSTNNEPESHGFVSFRIKDRSGLAEKTTIDNTAYIYFDQNPAIVTNTTQNIMVSKFEDISTSSQDKFFPQTLSYIPIQPKIILFWMLRWIISATSNGK